MNTNGRAPKASLRMIGFAGLLLIAGVGSGQLSAASAPLTTPLTLLELMRANVEIPADGIWAIESAAKLSDQEWLLAQQDAINIIASATFISTGGTGKQDRQWISNADYQAWARDVQQTGLQIRAAVRAKDQKKLADAADHLADVCQSCHDKYRPEKPSDGIARFPFYPARVMKK
jgi:hypothetical protein